MGQGNDWVSILGGMLQRMVVADVIDLELRRGALRVRLRRDPEAVAVSSGPDGAGATAPGVAALHRVAAPLTGIYYAAANPTSKPFVSVGDWLEPETVVGLIETMKVFNEVTADCRGRVATLLVQQGQLVHAGDAILLVDVSADPDPAGEVGP